MHISRQRQQLFQYPLADRVGFWGWRRRRGQWLICSFSILLRIELVFGARIASLVAATYTGFSILLRIELVFGALEIARAVIGVQCFSILLRIELVFGGTTATGSSRRAASFSILLRIELVFGVDLRQQPQRIQPVSVSSCGSSWFLGVGDPGLAEL